MAQGEDEAVDTLFGSIDLLLLLADLFAKAVNRQVIVVRTPGVSESGAKKEDAEFRNKPFDDLIHGNPRCQ